MSADRVLVAFASPQGSTAWVAEVLCAELGTAGVAVDCRPVAAVTDLDAYAAVVLGSGVFLARRGSDGGGFIARHREALARRPVWLFSAGPIGGLGAATNGGPECPEAPVVCVARALGARGAATFGAARPRSDDDGNRPSTDWAEIARVRAWARTIASELARAGLPGVTVRRPARPPLGTLSPGRSIVVTH